MIYEFICGFDVHNLLYAINGKQLDEEEIVSLTNDIEDFHFISCPTDTESFPQ